MCFLVSGSNEDNSGIYAAIRFNVNLVLLINNVKKNVCAHINWSRDTQSTTPYKCEVSFK